MLLGKHPALREGLTHLRAKGLQPRGQPVHPVLGGTGLVTLEEFGVGRTKEWVRRRSNQGRERLTIGSHQLLGGQIQQERPSQPVVQSERAVGLSGLLIVGEQENFLGEQQRGHDRSLAHNDHGRVTRCVTCYWNGSQTSTDSAKLTFEVCHLRGSLSSRPKTDPEMVRQDSLTDPERQLNLTYEHDS